MIYFVSPNKPLFNDLGYTTISVTESLNKLSKAQFLQCDSETTGLDPHLSKLLTFQIGTDEDQFVIDCANVDITLYKDILENNLCIFHNAKFDLQFLYNHGIILRRIYDTMIVEQLLYLGYPHVSLTSYEYKSRGYHYPYIIVEKQDSNVVFHQLSYSLKALCLKYLGLNVDKSIREDIPTVGLNSDIILYAASDVMYLNQIRKLQMQVCNKLKCLKGAKLECDAVPAIAYLEWCGIKLDEKAWKAKMQQDKENLDNSIKALTKFCRDTPILQKYTYQNLQGDLFAENPFDTEYKCSINWSSSKQVIEVAKLLGFNTSVVDKKTGELKDSVLEKLLQIQKGINDTFLKLYFDYRGYDKVVSSFGQTHLDSINPITNRLHTTYRQLATSSGRLSCGSNKNNVDLEKYKNLPKGSCKYVNCQQLPADKPTRSAFVAPENYLMVSADFSAEESRLGADIYQDKEMLKEFIEGSGDMHSLFAWMVFRKECEEAGCTCVEDVKTKAPNWRKKVKAVELSHADSY